MSLSLAEALERCASCPDFMAGGWCREASDIKHEDEYGFVERRPGRLVAITEIEICPKGRELRKEKS